MKFILPFLIIVSFQTLPVKGYSLSVKKRILKKISSFKKEFSIVVTDTKTGKVLIDFNGPKLRSTASLGKIPLAITLLEKIPMNHRWLTELLTVGNTRGSTLEGNLYLRGGGDPTITSEDFWSLVNIFSRNGIKKITGDIIVDESLFSKNYFANKKELVHRAYSSPISAMSFNWNSATFHVRPGNQLRKPLKIFVDPKSDYISLINKTTTRRGSRERVEIKRIRQGVFVATGSMGLRSEEKTIYRAILNPPLWAGHNLKVFLKQQGIEVLGAVKSGKTPQKADRRSYIKSPDIQSIVKDMMKFSNNLIADTMAKNLYIWENGENGHGKASVKLGVKKVVNFLRSLSLISKKNSLKSASGMDRENKISALEINKMLRHAWNSYNIQPEFITALPISGEDGTLKDRINSVRSTGAIRAKTGFLKGVVGLAGYAHRQKSNGHLSFVFIFNGPKKDSHRAIDLMNQLAYELTL